MKLELRTKNLTEVLFLEALEEWFKSNSKDYNKMVELTKYFQENGKK